MEARDPEAGVTLVEVLVALGLGALIAVAGFTVLSTTLKTQSRTDGRLERVAEIQRALHLISTDLEQISGPPLVIDGKRIGFTRPAFGAPERALGISYSLQDGALRREVRAISGVVAEQVLISAVRDVDWQLYTAPGAWGGDNDLDEETLPRAVRARIDLGSVDNGPAGIIQRIVRLPVVLE